MWFAQQNGASEALEGELPNLRWRIANDVELAVEKTESEKQKAETALPELDDETLQKLRETLAWRYGFGAATERAAKSSVTALRRQVADERDDEAEQIFPARRNIRTKLSAADTGVAHHKFLQHVLLENAGNVAVLEKESRRLETLKILTADEREVLDLKAVAEFWNSDTGQKIRRQVASVRRELAFTAKI